MINILEFGFLIILMALDALTAAGEIAIITVSRPRLRNLVSEGSRSAAIILKILENPQKFFGTILVANNVVCTMIAVLVTAMLIRLVGEGNWSMVLSTLIASFLIIVMEVAAKTIAVRYPERISKVLARPMSFLITVFTPIVKVFEIITEKIMVILGKRVPGKPSLVTEGEIKALIKIGEEEGVIHKDKINMLGRVFEFSDTIVRNVMTHKKDVVSIDVDSPLDDILEKVLESGYSRIPVYKGSPDNIVGIINMKDLLNLSVNKNLVVLQDIINPATVFPETKKVAELLKEFQKGHTHLGIVSDAKGKVSGIITLEDLLEEIVGEIEDEYDVRANYYKNPQ